jgi:hypothetical protein
MKRLIVAVVLSCSMSVLAEANSKDDAFEKIAKDYVEGLLAAHPEAATALGNHRFDDALTDYSPDSRQRRLIRAKQFSEALKEFEDVSQLTGPNQVDVRVLRENVDDEIFELEELKEAEWNPLLYNESLANSLYLLVARDFDVPEKRIENLRKRMEAMPVVIKQAQQNLKHPPRVHTETAIEQVQGAISLVREDLNPLLDQAPQSKKDLAPLQEKTARALEEYKGWLQKDLLPRSDGNFRLGVERFRKKLRFALASDLSVEEIMKRAQADLKQTQNAIYETAIPLYRKYFPKANESALNDRKKVVADVLAKLARDHPDDATVVDYARKVVTEATDFVKQHRLVTVPVKPLDVIVMPEFKRGVAIAY